MSALWFSVLFELEVISKASCSSCLDIKTVRDNRNVPKTTAHIVLDLTGLPVGQHNAKKNIRDTYRTTDFLVLEITPYIK